MTHIAFLRFPFSIKPLDAAVDSVQPRRQMLASRTRTAAGLDGRPSALFCRRLIAFFLLISLGVAWTAVANAKYVTPAFAVKESAPKPEVVGRLGPL